MSVLANIARTAARRPTAQVARLIIARPTMRTLAFAARSSVALPPLSIRTTLALRLGTKSFQSSTAVQGAWGPGLFESDQTLDIADSLEDLNGFPMRSFWGESEGQEEQSIAKLTRQHISTMMEQLTSGEIIDLSQPALYIAMCMKLGVKTYKKDLKSAERCVRRIIKLNQGNSYVVGMYEPLLEAIQEYENDGVTPWKPRELGLLETMTLGQENAQAYRDGEDAEVVLARWKAEKAERDGAKANSEASV